MSVTSDFKSWEEVREHFEAGEMVSYHIWTFSDSGMSCSEGCCNDSFKSIDEALESVKQYATIVERVESW
jgi:hypothetical protein